MVRSKLGLSPFTWAVLAYLSLSSAASPASGSGSASSGTPSSSGAPSSTSASASSSSSSATSSAAAASTTPTSSNGKNTKRGLSYPDNDNLPDVLNINQTKSTVSWLYDWGLTPPSNLAESGVEYVPMQWGSGGIENLSQTVKDMGAKVLLTFNEPDFDEQSNIDPNDAAKLWMQYIQPLKTSVPGIRLGAPAVSSGGSGPPWLTTFFNACSNCTFDFLPIHWYGEGTGGFYDYLYQMYGTFGNKTIWVTEYADTSVNQSDVYTFLNQTTVFLDGLDFVERYAWFGYFRPLNGSSYNMLNSNGSLNPLGELYIGADTVETSGPQTNTASGAAAGGGGPGPTLATVSAGAGSAPTFTPNGAIRNFKAYEYMWIVIGIALSCVVM